MEVEEPWKDWEVGIQVWCFKGGKEWEVKRAGLEQENDATCWCGVKNEKGLVLWDLGFAFVKV